MNQRRASSEVDIDGGISESEPTNETSRVAQSDEIVKQLEKSVPRWEGFGPGGWSTTIQLVRFPLSHSRFYPDEAVQADALPIVEQVRDYKDPRYAPAVTHKVPWFQRTPTAEHGSAPSWTLSRIWIQNSISHKWQVHQTTLLNYDLSQRYCNSDRYL